MSLLKREEEEEEIDCDDDYDDENLFSVSGKVVMITGGAKGVGKMITESFVKRKANKVIICGRNAKDLERVSKELNVAHEEGACDWIAADLSTEDGCESLCVEFKKRYIELDVLVNNAGNAWGEPFVRTILRKLPCITYR
jgi:short-subunit dehydrogenase